MGFFSNLFDDISTGIGCFVADVNYECAKEEAKRNGINVDALENRLNSAMMDCLQDEEADDDFEEDETVNLYESD